MTRNQQAAVDTIVERLTVGEKAWAATTLADRRRMLLALRKNLADAAVEWVEIARGIKGLPKGSPLVGEEWISGPWAVLSFTGALAETLEKLENGSDVLDGLRLDKAPGNRVAIRVSPHGTFDQLLFSGFRTEVWLRPGVTETQARTRVGLGQRTPHQTQGVALVLGAGNIFSLAPLDTLQQLYAANRAVVLKLNPVTDPLHPVFERIFAPFIELGALQIVTGDGWFGDTLAHHPGISAVHLTGSEATHNAIVWGTGDDAEAARRAGTPRLHKPITSELGGVSPVIVVPGEWSQADLKFQAEHVATQRLHNSGHNCVGSQIVIISSDWAQKDAFMSALRKALATAPSRPAWYPGSARGVESARALHPTAESVGGTPERTLLTGLDLTDSEETAFNVEYFGPVLGTGVGFLTARATWGAFPGHPLEDIQSGRGVVNNALLIDDTERTVVYGPFRPAPRSLRHGELSLTPKPAWFVSNKTAATTGRLLTDFVYRPTRARHDRVVP